MEKIIRLSIENTTKIRQVEDSFCELYSHDKNNGAFEFEISKGTLTNENVVALFKFLRSGSYWKTNGTVEDNKIKFNFDTSLITQNEEVVCYIYLDKEERNSDIFRFKFKVNLSEIDKASQLPVKERYFANSMIVDRVDVLTKEDFDKALAEISKGSHFLTEDKANEKYALKGDIPNVSNFVSSDHLSDYALKTEIPSTETIVNKTVEKVEKKGYLTEHQSLAGYVTETQLEGKNYLTSHQPLTEYVKKTELPQPYNDTDIKSRLTALEGRPVTSSYDDREIKRKIKELEDRPVTANIDTSNFVTNTQLEGKHYLTEHQDIKGLATKEELRKAFLDEEDHEKYAKKTDLPQPYNDTDIKSRLKTLEDRPAGNVDTSDFVTYRIYQSDKEFFNTQLNRKLDRGDTPFTFALYGDTPYLYFQKTNQGGQEKAFGKIYCNRDERIIISGYGKYTNLDTALYTLAGSIPDNYTPDFEFGEDDNVKLITNKNIGNYINKDALRDIVKEIMEER